MSHREGWEIVRQIPESDPEYKIAHEQERQHRGQSRPFGYSERGVYEHRQEVRERVEGSIRDMQEKLAQTPDQNSEDAQRFKRRLESDTEFLKKFETESSYLKELFERFAIDVARLLDSPLMEERKAYIQKETARMFWDPEVLPKLEPHFGKDLSELTTASLLEKVRDGSVSEDLLYKIVCRHHERFSAQEKELSAFAEKEKEDFRRIVARAAIEGSLPKAALKGLDRIDDVRVVLVDQLTEPNSQRLGSTDGHGTVDVLNQRLQEQNFNALRKTLFHEFTHAISGQSVTLEKKQLDERYTSRHLTQKKTGVMLRRENTDHGPNKWLNEAITEWLAIRLSGKTDERPDAYQGSMSYTDERRELSHLFDQGLTEAEVMNAYFENFESSQSKEEKGKHYRTLVQHINAVEGVGGFNRLEYKHVLNEIDLALCPFYVYPRSAVPDSKLTDPQNTVYRIRVTVGNNPKIATTEEMVYWTRPYTIGDQTFSAESQWESIKQIIKNTVASYGGMASYSEIT